jgi:hypothetical protein
MMMGVGTPILPDTINIAAPSGDPRGDLVTDSLPHRAKREAMSQGIIVPRDYVTCFHCMG